MTADAWRRALAQLLPRGVAWLLEPDSMVSKTLHAIGDELARIDARGDDLIEESDPRTATETLGDWERSLSLPDESVPEIPTTTAERQRVVAAKYTARGGQNQAFFVRLADQCGYTVTVSNFYPDLFRVGRSRVGHRLHSLAAAYAMIITVTATAGDALTQDQFELIIRHSTHAHITVVFRY